MWLSFSAQSYRHRLGSGIALNISSMARTFNPSLVLRTVLT